MKTLLFISLLLASVIVLAMINQYLFCPVYSFAKASSFQGDSIYNPYSSIAKNKWVKCNFHAHAHCWDGITYGNATANDIHRIYTNLHYGVAAVSNYQLIDTTRHSQNNYISAYEHGCNVLKNHQLVLGAKEVCWKDYYLPETISNKQDVLNHLSDTDTSSLYIINHPMVRGGYCASDFAKLTNYSCMEVLNPACNSSAFWDAALSAGKPVFIVGNDDCHNVLDSTKVGKICTWINVPEVNKENVIQALKTGNSFAMTVGEKVRSEIRLGNNDSMPVVKAFSVINNQIKARFTLSAKEMIVTGANGKLLATSYHTDSVVYNLYKNDSYARIIADYGNGTELFLNPVFRYTKQPLQQVFAGINANQTLLFRTIGAIALLFWFNFVFKLIIPKKFQNIPLDILNKGKYGNNSGNAYPKGSEVGYRRVIRHVYRFFYNLGQQRKNRFE